MRKIDRAKLKRIIKERMEYNNMVVSIMNELVYEEENEFDKWDWLDRYEWEQIWLKYKGHV